LSAEIQPKNSTSSQRTSTANQKLPTTYFRVRLFLQSLAPDQLFRRVSLQQIELGCTRILLKAVIFASLPAMPLTRPVSIWTWFFIPAKQGIVSNTDANTIQERFIVLSCYLALAGSLTNITLHSQGLLQSKAIPFKMSRNCGP